MMDDSSLGGQEVERQEIVRLLAKLKEETPEYPDDLLESRKYSFMKQIVDMQVSAGNPPATGSAGGSSRAGAALRGGATILGLPLKTLLAVGAAILLLAAGVLFREQIVEFLAENGVIATENTAPPLFGPRPGGSEQETPSAGAPFPGGGATQPTPGSRDDDLPGTPTSPTESGPANIFEYLICILQSGPRSCK